MSSGKIVAGGRVEKSKVLQEVLADLKKLEFRSAFGNVSLFSGPGLHLARRAEGTK